MGHYVYTLYDFDDGNNIKLENQNIREFVGEKTREILKNKFEEIRENGEQVAIKMLKFQMERENQIYNSLGLAPIQTDSNGKITNADNLIEQMRNKLYDLDDKQKSVKNSEDCIKLLGDFFIELLTKNTDIKGENIEDYKEAIYNLKNIRDSFKKYYDQLTNNLKEVADRNNIAINDILEVTEYWNTEIKSSLKSGKNGFTFYEESGEINGNLSLEELKKILTAYKGKQNDIIGGIGEAATIFLTKEIKEHITDNVIRIIDKGTTSRWDEKSAIYKKNYEDTVIEAVQELKNNKYVEEIFDMDTSKNLKADEVFDIILKTNDSKIEKIISFGISNKTGFSKSGALKIQETSVSSLLTNIFRVENSAYQETYKIRENLLDLMVNEAGEIAWKGTNFTIKSFNDLLRELINRYAYVWFTGGRSGIGHADFFSLYKNGKLYFIPMSIILQEISVDLPSTLILRGINANEYIIFEGQLKELDKLKRGKSSFGNTVSKQLNEMELDSIKGINKSGRVELGNYRRLGL